MRRRSTRGSRRRGVLVMNFNLGREGYTPERGGSSTIRSSSGRRRCPACAARPSRRTPPLAGGFPAASFPKAPTPRPRSHLVQVNTVGLGYFQTIGIPIVRGRDFTRADIVESPKVVVINQTMAQQFWKGEEPLGKRFKFFGDNGLHHGRSASRATASTTAWPRSRCRSSISRSRRTTRRRATLHVRDGRRRRVAGGGGAPGGAAARSDAVALQRPHARGAGRPVARSRRR